jgi:uncharacterized DUF497 family protein
MTTLDDIAKCDGFEWDDDNVFKNWHRHGVSPAECEEVFFNRPFVVGRDAEHSRSESRFFALGLSDSGRGLFVVFTLRETLIRVISARDMTRREWRRYGRS